MEIRNNRFNQCASSISGIVAVANQCPPPPPRISPSQGSQPKSTKRSCCPRDSAHQNNSMGSSHPSFVKPVLLCRESVNLHKKPANPQILLPSFLSSRPYFPTDLLLLVSPLRHVRLSRGTAISLILLVPVTVLHGNLIAF